MRKKISVLVMIIGLVLFIVGLFTKIPNKELTTYLGLSDKCSVIEEYVGGDAYNYIIRASLVGGEIAGAKTQKAVFISVGSLIFVLGLLAYSSSKEKIEETNKDNATISMENTIIDNKNINDTNINEENIIDDNLQ